MFKYENVITGKMNVEKLWDLYTDVNRWAEWDTGIQKVELEGEFAAGTKGTIFINGIPPVPFTLDEVEKGGKFVNSAMLGNVSVKFGHFIIDDGNGEYTLKHTVIITGPNEGQLQGMGREIVSSINDSMENLFQLLRMD